MPMVRENTAQDLCNELFLELEGPMSDAWVSDDACTDDPDEYLRFVRGSLGALKVALGNGRGFAIVRCQCFAFAAAV